MRQRPVEIRATAVQLLVRARVAYLIGVEECSPLKPAAGLREAQQPIHIRCASSNLETRTFSPFYLYPSSLARSKRITASFAALFRRDGSLKCNSNEQGAWETVKTRGLSNFFSIEDRVKKAWIKGEFNHFDFLRYEGG